MLSLARLPRPVAAAGVAQQTRGPAAGGACNANLNGNELFFAPYPGTYDRYFTRVLEYSREYLSAKVLV